MRTCLIILALFGTALLPAAASAEGRTFNSSELRSLAIEIAGLPSGAVLGHPSEEKSGYGGGYYLRCYF